ncbi:flagellar hook-basal body complex protein [Sphingomonas sp. MMS24-JH45]
MQAATDVMLRAQRRLEVSAVNIANIATPGFKPIAEDGAFAGAVTRVRARMDQGKLQDTGRPLDLAIAGEGLFAVRDGDRIAYTRQGEFALDHDGRVVRRRRAMSCNRRTAATSCWNVATSRSPATGRLASTGGPWRGSRFTPRRRGRCRPRSTGRCSRLPTPSRSHRRRSGRG